MEWKCCRKTPCLLFSVCLYWSYGRWAETWQWWMIIWKLEACKNISHTPVNVSTLCSTKWASTHFSNLSPKSNKLPKYVHFASFLWPRTEKKRADCQHLFPLCAPPIPFCGACRRPRVSQQQQQCPATQRCLHPPTLHPSIPLKLSEAKVSIWGRISGDGSAAAALTTSAILNEPVVSSKRWCWPRLLWVPPRAAEMFGSLHFAEH